MSEDDVVVEVGARVGNATLKLASLCRFVHAVEANHRNYKLLKAYARRKPNVRTYEFAAWSSDGDGILRVSDNDIFSGVSSIGGINGKRYTTTQKVKLVPLDSVSFDPPPTILVTDCEGAEPEVLKGAKVLLGRVGRAAIETHIMSNGSSTLVDVEGILAEAGFKTSHSVEKWVVARREEDRTNVPSHASRSS